MTAEGVSEGRKYWQVRGSEIISVWLEHGDSGRTGGTQRGGQIRVGLVDMRILGMLFKMQRETVR